MKDFYIHIRLVQFVYILLLGGCSSYGPVNIQLPAQSINTDTPAGLARVIFFNTSDQSFAGLPFAGNIQLAISGDWYPDIDKNSYLQLFLKPGEYDVKLQHTDSFAFTDSYDLVVGNDTVYVNIFRRMFSNELVVVDELPLDFEKKFKRLYP